MPAPALPAASPPESVAAIYCTSLEAHGDRSRAAEAAGLTPAQVRYRLSRDGAWAAQVADAWHNYRSGLAARVSARVLAVALDGVAETLTYRGRITYEVARHSDGQPIMDPARDADGQPIMAGGSRAPGPQYVERLALDASGQPIPVIVRRYPEATTLRLAEALGVLAPADSGASAPDPHMVLLDAAGRRCSIADLLQARYTATATPPQSANDTNDSPDRSRPLRSSHP